MVLRSQGAEVELESWADMQGKFDAYLASEPEPFDKETEKLRLLGLR